MSPTYSTMSCFNDIASWKSVWKTNLNSEGLELCFDALRTVVLQGCQRWFVEYVSACDYHVFSMFFFLQLYICVFSLICTVADWIVESGHGYQQNCHILEAGNLAALLKEFYYCVRTKKQEWFSHSELEYSDISSPSHFLGGTVLLKTESFQRRILYSEVILQSYKRMDWIKLPIREKLSKTM